MVRAAGPTPPAPITLVSYNVHRCTGIDLRRRPERIARVLQQLGGDIVGLQEIDTRDAAPGPDGLLGYLAHETGLQAIAGPAIFHAGGSFYGNLLLTRFPVEDVRHLDLAVAGREPRSALDVDLRLPAGSLLRVLVTHLGLTRAERREQIDRLLAALGAPTRSMIALLGDFNEWLPVRDSVLRLDKALGATARPRTFPAWRPLLPLDRIWVEPVSALEDLKAVMTRVTLRASDHLPLRAQLRLP